MAPDERSLKGMETVQASIRRALSDPHGPRTPPAQREERVSIPETEIVLSGPLTAPGITGTPGPTITESDITQVHDMRRLDGHIIARITPVGTVTRIIATSTPLRQ